ncbi:unnamed protein product [Urochloa humidicola]
MGTPVQVTPLSGAYGEGPLCYLLVVDGFRFLLDCGWTDLCDTSQLGPLAKYGLPVLFLELYLVVESTAITSSKGLLGSRAGLQA